MLWSSGKDLHLHGQVVINSVECYNQSFNKVYESSASRFRSTFGAQKEWKWSVTFSLLAPLRCNQNDMLDFVVFEKFTSDDLSQIAGETSFDYLLIIYMQKFESFPLPPRKEIQLLSRFLWCVLFIWVLAEDSVASGVSSIAVFVFHTGFYSRETEKAKAFLASLAFRSCISVEFGLLHFFFALFNGGHNYFKQFLTVTLRWIWGDV